ncbi:YlaI family protein [Virgibacillus sp. MSP4-1]|uniref:YlaI family protein n=1 Tax=Virgibacillus sp. MSP4-1 TaxID=2700081 RepID=UPI0003A7CCB0|nr:YlaI family protein [Virgibacillus sp. MSP4-1]QHS22120.1 YlaI family protein [Virgibacillus sp. MSP4-1]
MKVKCILCDKVEKIAEDSLLAKQLRKKRVMTYMCDTCRERIDHKTEKRLDTGNYREYREKKKDPYL